MQDEAGSIHTSYFINVTMTLGNESWRVGHRYSEFYSLYSSIYNQLGKAFPSGMHDMFPTDRLSNWLSSANQETINDKRRKALDSWLREVCNSPHMMLDEVTRKSIFSFFQVDENMTARGKSSSQKAESAGSVKTSTQCPQPSKNPLSLLKSFTRRSEGSTTPAAQDTPKANSTNAEFDNRKRAALAAQRNDYSSVQSERELRQQSNQTEVHLRSSEVRSIPLSALRLEVNAMTRKLSPLLSFPYLSLLSFPLCSTSHFTVPLLSHSQAARDSLMCDQNLLRGASINKTDDLVRCTRQLILSSYQLITSLLHFLFFAFGHLYNYCS